MTYRGYNLDKTDAGSVYVTDPRNPDDPVYIANDMDSAKDWICAYRNGAIWACSAALR